MVKYSQNIMSQAEEQCSVAVGSPGIIGDALKNLDGSLLREWAV